MTNADGTFRRAVLFAACFLFATGGALEAAPLREVIRGAQPKIVKIQGAGGYRGLEAYQSGFLFSADGYILTVMSYVLDTDYITVTLDNGRKFEEAKLVASDPRLELAVLKIDGSELPHFDLAAATTADSGTRVLAFSNMFGVAVGDEEASVLHGVVSVVTKLNARRGAFATPYDGPAYIVDAMTNNPGAAGGALVDYRGNLLGMLGKELRHTQSNIWLNFAIPTSELRETAEAIRTGKYVRRAPEERVAKPDQPQTLDLLGIVLVPDVLERTPPFIDAVVPGSSAAMSDVRPDDQILFINNRITQSCAAVRNELDFIHRVDPVKATLLRGQELIEVTLRAPLRSSTSAAAAEKTP
ncbi:MAG: S1C family serine protease [Planctomycetia bacterium]|nr:S1C family serine protease [Planctomycetia bacterium]